MTTPITPREFALMAKSHMFQFHSYYKYTFIYTSITDPNVFVSVGGNHDNIYKADMNREMTLLVLLEECGSEYATGYVGKEWVDLDHKDVWDVLVEETDE